MKRLLPIVIILAAGMVIWMHYGKSRNFATRSNAAQSAVTSSKPSASDPVAERHREAANRKRTIVYNTDGCDMVYYPKRAKVEVGDFCAQRIRHMLGTKISTMSYCPLASGFAHFTSFRVGYPLTATVNPESGSYNATTAFWEQLHTDALEMALEFAKTNGVERFLSIRMNDSHDGSHLDPNPSSKNYLKPHPFFTKFKTDHPECLMGRQGGKDGKPVTCYWQWTCVNYMEPLVQQEVRKFIRQFCENYDMEGIELDFCRHLMYVKDVVYGGTANDAQRKVLTDMMSDLREIVKEYEAKKGHAILLTARVPDSIGYCKDIGFDLPAWLKNDSVDALIGGCYFNLEDPSTMAKLCHSYGKKFYTSVDESRIRHKEAIPGRDSAENYNARFAASIDAGADAVYLFNREGGWLHNLAQTDPHDTVGLNKIYFATERGPGGYGPDHYLVGGGKKWRRLPNLVPADSEEHERIVSTLADYSVKIRLAEDFAAAEKKGLKAKVELLVRSRAEKPEQMKLKFNGKDLGSPATVEKGLSIYPVETSQVKRGINDFVFSAVEKSYTLRDLAVRVTYSKN